MSPLNVIVSLSPNTRAELILTGGSAVVKFQVVLSAMPA